MSDRYDYPPQDGQSQWRPKQSANQQNSGQWSHGGYQQPYTTDPARMHYQPYGAAPQMSDPSQKPPAQQRPRQRRTSRAGLLVAGTAVVAMAAGAATAVALVDHSGPAAPAPAAAPVGKSAPATAPVAGQQTSVSAPGSVEQVSAKVLPSVVKIQIDSGQASRGGLRHRPQFRRADPDQQPCGGRGRRHRGQSGADRRRRRTVRAAARRTQRRWGTGDRDVVGRPDRAVHRRRN